MQPRLTGLLPLLVALLMAGGCGDSEPAPQPAEPVLRPSDVPEGSSGTVVAARDGELVACQGWGLADREAEVDATCDTVYDVMSMTKQFTAAAVLKLQMQGALRVTDPIHRYLDDVPPDKRGITVQDLLTHTSGLVASVGDDYERLSRDGLLARAFGSELRSRPGARHHYSNVGYSLLAAIVEEASGTGYEEFLAQHLFAPAGMQQTGYVLPEWRPSDVAVEYDEQGEPHGRPFEHPWADDGPYWNLRGNGGMLSTARDMFRWHRALEGDQVLDAAARRELFRPRVLEEPGGSTRYAYGWVVADTRLGPVQWHNGGNGWSYGEIVRLPDAGAFVFWVTNQYRSTAGGWDLEADGSGLTELVAERLVDPD